MGVSTLVYGGLALTVLLMLYLFARSGRFFRCLSYTATTGLGSLLLTYGVGLYTVPLVTLSPLALLLSVTLGLPGVLGLMVFQLL